MRPRLGQCLSVMCLPQEDIVTVVTLWDEQQLFVLADTRQHILRSTSTPHVRAHVAATFTYHDTSVLTESIF